MRVRRRGRGALELLADLAIGAAAGAVGTWLMQPAAKLVPRLPGIEPPQPVKSAQQTVASLSGEEAATEVVARKVLGPLGVEVTGARKAQLGQAVHWGYGVSWGALYGLLVGRGRGTAFGSGVLLGFGLWLVGDEVLVPALRLAKPPGEYPVKVHAQALASHLAYGTATDSVFRVVRSALNAGR